MKRITTLFFYALALMLTAGCDYDDTELWDKVNDHEERLAALERWQAEVNNNIAALQTLLNTNDMITDITPVTMGDEVVGYTISFLHSDPITIYNGEKGEAGEAGADGETPQIGLTQGEDGNWYWTLNGELMTDTDGGQTENPNWEIAMEQYLQYLADNGIPMDQIRYMSHTLPCKLLGIEP